METLKEGWHFLIKSLVTNNGDCKDIPDCTVCPMYFLNKCHSDSSIRKFNAIEILYNEIPDT